MSFSLDSNLGYFCGAIFLCSLVLDKTMLNVSRDHGSWSTCCGKQVKVSKSIKMFSIIDKSECSSIETTRGWRETRPLTCESFMPNSHTRLIWVGGYNFQPYWDINFQYCTNYIEENTWFHFKKTTNNLLKVTTKMYQISLFSTKH